MVRAEGGAAHSESGFPIVERSISAYDVKLADTRRTMCAGFFFRSICDLYSQLPHFSAPEIDHMSKRASGDVMVEQGDESGGPLPAVLDGGGANERIR